MACKKSPETKSFLANTVGSVGMEQIMVVATVGLLGVGGFTTLGDGMRDDIASNGRNGGAKASMAVASEAGTDLSLCGDGKCGRTLNAKTIQKGDKSYKELPFGAKHAGNGESFWEGLERGLYATTTEDGPHGLDWMLPGRGTGVDDIFRGLITSNHDVLDLVTPDVIMNPIDRGLGLLGFLADQALPGKGLLPGDVLDGILPGTGFMGPDGYVTRVRRNASAIGRWIRDAVTFNDEGESIDQMLENDMLGTYNVLTLQTRALQKQLELAREYITRLERGETRSADVYEGAVGVLGDVNAILSTREYQRLAARLKGAGADEALDTLNAQIKRVRDQEKDLADLQKRLFAQEDKVVDNANGYALTFYASTSYADSLVAAASEVGTPVPAFLASLAYQKLQHAQSNITLAIENYDAALSEMGSAPDHRALEAARTDLMGKQAILGGVIDNLVQHSEPIDPAIGTAIVQEQGGAVVTR